MNLSHSSQDKTSEEDQIKIYGNTEYYELLRRSSKLKETFVDRQYKQRLVALDNAMTASICSILYAGELMDLMMIDR